MSIPTGADYHICKGKSYLDDARQDVNLYENSANFALPKLIQCLESLIRALELMRQEQERKTQKTI